jgi:hypothetical protein
MLLQTLQTSSVSVSLHPRAHHDELALLLGMPANPLVHKIHHHDEPVLLFSSSAAPPLQTTLHSALLHAVSSSTI